MIGSQQSPQKIYYRIERLLTMRVAIANLIAGRSTIELKVLLLSLTYRQQQLGRSTIELKEF